jgi:heme/copper-type cytochrome/quinol oxidase subunit 3
MSAQPNAIPFTRDRNLVGVALFIGSESLFFLGLVIAYLVLREQGLAAAKLHLDVGRTALFSVLLFSSSGTVGLATARRSRAWLGLTVLLGVAFLAGQGLEYARLLGAGVRPGSELFGTTFFTLTGLHAVHVLVGLVLLVVLQAASAARPRRVGNAAWEGIAMYWHFVDVVWVVVFSVVYLGTLIG